MRLDKETGRGANGSKHSKQWEASSYLQNGVVRWGAWSNQLSWTVIGISKGNFGNSPPPASRYLTWILVCFSFILNLVKFYSKFMKVSKNFSKKVLKFSKFRFCRPCRPPLAKITISRLLTLILNPMIHNGLHDYTGMEGLRLITPRWLKVFCY